MKEKCKNCGVENVPMIDGYCFPCGEAIDYPPDDLDVKTYFVSRHAGAVQWAKEQGINVDNLVSHLDTTIIKSGDTVIGSLPVNLAEQVCAVGARYLHLSLEIPADLRGVELTAEQMTKIGAKLQWYLIDKVD